LDRDDEIDFENGVDQDDGQIKQAQLNEHATLIIVPSLILTRTKPVNEAGIKEGNT
jgi:hypothetical protein